MKLVEKIMKNNPCYKVGRKITVKGLMLHSVGCPQPSAMAFINNWNRTSYGSACVHGFIDANDGTAYQTLPWNHRGWHCGASGNNTHIGIEMCEPACIKYTGGSTFKCSDLKAAKEAVKRTYDTAVELFAMLCKEYNLNPLAKGVIVSHKEGCALGIASNHGDPEHLWNQLGTGYTMNGFRNDVKNKMSGTSTKTSSTSTTSSKDVAKTAFIMAVQRVLGANVDGIAGKETLSKTITVSSKKNRTHEVVGVIQTYLNALGYNCGKVDCIAGTLFDAAVKAYQKDHGCVADGEITARNKTWKKLLGMA